MAGEVVAVQFGYIGLRLRERFGMDRSVPGRDFGRHKHSVLRGDGSEDPLVAIQRLPHVLFHAVVYHRRRIWYRAGLNAARRHLAPRIVVHRCHRRRGSWIVDLRLLRGGAFSDRPTGQLTPGIEPITGHLTLKPDGREGEGITAQNRRQIQSTAVKQCRARASFRH